MVLLRLPCNNSREIKSAPGDSDWGMQADTKTLCVTALRWVSHHPVVDAVRRTQSSDAEASIPIMILIVRYIPDPVKQTFERFIRPIRRNPHNILITEFTPFCNWVTFSIQEKYSPYSHTITTSMNGLNLMIAPTSLTFPEYLSCRINL
jgi:hypothetical protein